jgi:hypothetical protein
VTIGVRSVIGMRTNEEMLINIEAKVNINLQETKAEIRTNQERM